MNKEIERTIRMLVARKCEGVHWDFKRMWPEKKATLVHDILCLANARHKGSRYLIFGVNEKDYSFHDVGTDPHRWKEDDLTSFFRDNANKFSESRYPTFWLHNLILDGNAVDILEIDDQPYKPYYLTRNHTGCSPHIYTRHNRTNTPRDRSAPAPHLEWMFRERAGLDKTPKERMKQYLLDTQSWVAQWDVGDVTRFYYEEFPEFTIRHDKQSLLQSSMLIKHLVKPVGHLHSYELNYHQTMLSRIPVVTFESSDSVYRRDSTDRHKSMVVPNDRPMFELGVLFYYNESSMRHAMQKWLVANASVVDHSEALPLYNGEGPPSEKERGVIEELISTRGDDCLCIPVIPHGKFGEFWKCFMDQIESGESFSLSTMDETYSKRRYWPVLSRRDKHLGCVQLLLIANTALRLSGLRP